MDNLEPKVKAVPTFKVGEIVELKADGKRMKILGIEKGAFRCEGVANLLHPSAVQKVVQ